MIVMSDYPATYSEYQRISQRNDERPDVVEKIRDIKICLYQILQALKKQEYHKIEELRNRYRKCRKEAEKAKNKNKVINEEIIRYNQKRLQHKKRIKHHQEMLTEF